MTSNEAIAAPSATTGQGTVLAYGNTDRRIATVVNGQVASESIDIVRRPETTNELLHEIGSTLVRSIAEGDDWSVLSVPAPIRTSGDSTLIGPAVNRGPLQGIIIDLKSELTRRFPDCARLFGPDALPRLTVTNDGHLLTMAAPVALADSGIPLWDFDPPGSPSFSLRDPADIPSDTYDDSPLAKLLLNEPSNTELLDLDGDYEVVAGLIVGSGVGGKAAFRTGQGYEVNRSLLHEFGMTSNVWDTSVEPNVLNTPVNLKDGNATVENLISGPAVEHITGIPAHELPDEHPYWKLVGKVLLAELIDVRLATGADFVLLGGSVAAHRQHVLLPHMCDDVRNQIWLPRSQRTRVTRLLNARLIPKIKFVPSAEASTYELRGAVGVATEAERQAQRLIRS